VSRYHAFEVSSEELTGLVAHTLANSDTDLARFSDGQINYGLQYILNNACSSAVFDVLGYALGSRNVACVESALHGLGHLRLHRAREVMPMIGRRNRGLRPELRRYAENAAAGCIL
jgi:hypothetical protein